MQFARLTLIIGCTHVSFCAHLEHFKSWQNSGSANIKTMDAAYDGLKSTINVMANMTDGLPWPLKAAPQTFLYVLRLFEVRDVECCGAQWYHNADHGN